MKQAGSAAPPQSLTGGLRNPVEGGDGSEREFDRLAKLAAAVTGAPNALVTFVGADSEQPLESGLGFAGGQATAGLSFCADAFAKGDGFVVVADAQNDPRFRDNPAVTGGPHIRFYAGVPLVVDGVKIGTICAFDDKPREQGEAVPIDRLQELAGLAANLVVLKDTSRKGMAAAAALVRVEQRHKLALEAATIASWVWDLRTGMVECDPLLPELFGLAPATRLKAKSLFFAIDRRDLRKTNEALRSAIESSADYAGEYRVRGTSPTRWLSTRGRVTEWDADGKPSLVIGVSYDISERKWAEETQRLLLRELNHRVKNTLATVQALASQTVRHASDPRAFLQAFGDRLRSLGKAHGLLSDHEWRGIGLDELVHLQVQPFDDPQSPRIRISGPRVWLMPEHAVALGLILHELAGNALKYGALSVRHGIVELAWRVHGPPHDRRVKLLWTESGGPPVAPPQREGFGSILIRRSLDKVLGSEVKHEFHPAGVRAEVSLPLGEPE